MSRLIKNGNSIVFKSILENRTLSYYFLVIILILIPLYIWFIPPFMVLWGISWIIESRINKEYFNKKNKIQNWLFIFFIAFYLWQAVGIFYSDDMKSGMNTFYSRLSLFLFPIVLLIPGKKIEKNIALLLKIFATSTSLFVFICFGHALYNSVFLQNGILVFNSHPQKEYWMNFFYSSYFSLNQHPSYLAMYVILSGFISFESWFDNTAPKWKRYAWLLNGMILVISLYFLSSRSGLLTIFILAPVYLIKKFYRHHKLIMVTSILLLLVFSFFIVRTNERVKIGINEIANETFLSKDGRISIWSSALHSIRNNLIIGVGIGDVKTELMKEYIRQGDQNLIKNRYNVHNQYLEILMENGIIGLAFFLSIMGVMLYLAFAERNTLYYFFIIMMLIFFLFETVMERLQGVSFFALFSFLLIYASPDKQSVKINCKNPDK
jgi:O-antigen ligase